MTTDGAVDALVCPQHGPGAEPEYRFCEVCGERLRPVHRPADWLSSRSADAACAACGTVRSGGSDYCDHCGRRHCCGSERAELDLGVLAGVTDRARRQRNEDAVTLGRTETASVAVICDGVSTSRRSDVAAHAAAETGIASILAALRDGVEPATATGHGLRAAARAAADVALPDEEQAPPSCTYVSGIVTAGTITVGWIGDSRAYWVASASASASASAWCLTVDDSVVGQLTAGRALPPGVEAAPDSRALLRWLGADAPETEPQVVSFRVDGSGLLVLCSDGLSQYLADPAELAEATSAVAGSPLAVARDLTRLALAAGGSDNITVAVLPSPIPARPVTVTPQGAQW